MSAEEESNPRDSHRNSANPDGKDGVGRAMELYLEQLEAGDRPDRQKFLNQFPEIKDELQAQLEAIEFLHRAAPEVSGGPESRESLDHEAELHRRATLGDFRLVRPIGRGGMGIVYEAIQMSLDRRVAVKVLPFAAMMDARQRKRFHNEARAAATLDHPHIVPIHFVGQERGVHFYAMQLIDGQSLAEVIACLRLAEGTENPDNHRSWSESRKTVAQHSIDEEAAEPLNVKDTIRISALSTQRSLSGSDYARCVAELGIQVAEALQHAHDQGVVHRDIKPGNLLLDEEGKLWVTDFGLARIENNESITSHGDVLGTIAYMSPEQIEGSNLVDARSDVYSLGATLFELLTLKRPFAKEGSGLRRSTPRSIRVIDSQIPFDFETIIGKAMSQDPVDRYETAAAFGADLSRFASGHTILARPPSVTDRISKWTRRHPMSVLTGLVSALLLCAVLAAGVVLVWKSQQRATSALAEARTSANAVEDLLYLADVQLAYQAWDTGRSDQVSEILGRHVPDVGEVDRRGFEWYALDSISRQPEPEVIGRHVGSANQLAVFPDGKRVASVGEDKKLRIWDLEKKKELAVIGMGDSSEEPLFSVAVAPDGKTVATGSDCVQLWDVETGDRKMLLTSFDSNVQSIAFSPDGQWVAAASRYDRVRVFSSSGEFVGEIEDDSRHESLEFTPDSTQLLVPSRRQDDLGRTEGIVRAWNATLSEVESEYSVTATARMGNLTLAGCSPRGDFYVLSEHGAYYPLRIIDADTGELLEELQQSGDQVRSIAISPQGSLLAVAYANGSIAIWELERQPSGGVVGLYRRREIRCHDGEITSVQFANTNQVVTSGADGHLKLWVLPTLSRPQLKRPSVVGNVEISPDGKWIAAKSIGSLYLTDSDGKMRVTRSYGEMDRTYFSPDSTKLVIATRRRVDVLDVPSGDQLHTIAMTQVPAAISFAPNGDEMVVIDGVGDLRFWRTHDWEELASISIDGKEDKHIYRCLHTREGGRVVCAGEFGDIAVVDTSSRQIVKRVPVASAVKDLTFDEDENALATAHRNGSIQIWNWPELTPKGLLTGHERPVSGLAFAPDGTIISVGHDNTTRLWSSKHLREFGVLDRRNYPGSDLALSSDGSLLCVGYSVFDESEPGLALFRINGFDQ